MSRMASDNLRLRSWLAGLIDNQQGQSMVEMLIILPVMLLLIFATVQLALIYHAKITLNYAAYEAVRAGSLTCDKKYYDYDTRCVSDVSQYEAVKEGFARGLAPLYSYFEPDKALWNYYMKDSPVPPANNQVEAYQLGRAKVFSEFDAELDLIRIERLNPTREAFTDFAVDGVIPNDNLMYRSRIAGGSSQMSVQDANLLHLRFTYWYPLYVPFVNTLLFNTAICCRGTDAGGLCKWGSDPVCQGDTPRIPLTATAVMRMQTPVENGSDWYSAR